MYTGKFKMGDRVRVVSKSKGDTLDLVETRYYAKYGCEWNRIGIVANVNYSVDIDYVVLSEEKKAGGDFYKEHDLRGMHEDEIEKELFEI